MKRHLSDRETEISLETGKTEISWSKLILSDWLVG